MSEKKYTPTEITRLLNNAVMAAKSPATLPIPEKALARLMYFTKGFLEVPRELLTEGAITAEELVLCLASCALAIQTQYAAEETPKAIRDYIEQTGLNKDV